MNRSIFQDARFQPTPDQADQARIAYSMFDKPKHPIMIETPERRHDRLPITKTIQTRSSSFVNGMYSKGAGSLSSGASQGGASLSFL
jgi:hypothetical protein